MKPLVLAAFSAVFFASAASAMTPETAQYLKQIGLNPESRDILAVDQEGPVTTSFSGRDPEEFSLDSLASQKKKLGIQAFIGTRNFIRRLKSNFAGTSIPKTQYDPMYLTSDERGLVGKKFVEGMLASN